MPIKTYDDIRAFATIKVDNNYKGVIDSLAKHGFPPTALVKNAVSEPITRHDVGTFLMALYNRDKDMFVKVLQDVPYNPNAMNYTTTKTFTDAFTALAQTIK